MQQLFTILAFASLFTLAACGDGGGGGGGAGAGGPVAPPATVRLTPVVLTYPNGRLMANGF